MYTLKNLLNLFVNRVNQFHFGWSLLCFFLFLVLGWGCEDEPSSMSSSPLDTLQQDMDTPTTLPLGGSPQPQGGQLNGGNDEITGGEQVNGGDEAGQINMDGGNRGGMEEEKGMEEEVQI